MFPEIGRVIEDNLIAEMESEDDDGPMDVSAYKDAYYEVCRGVGMGGGRERDWDCGCSCSAFKPDYY